MLPSIPAPIWGGNLHIKCCPLVGRGPACEAAVSASLGDAEDCTVYSGVPQTNPTSKLIFQ